MNFLTIFEFFFLSQWSVIIRFCPQENDCHCSGIDFFPLLIIRLQKELEIQISHVPISCKKWTITNQIEQFFIFISRNLNWAHIFLFFFSPSPLPQKIEVLQCLDLTVPSEHSLHLILNDQTVTIWFYFLGHKSWSIIQILYSYRCILLIFWNAWMNWKITTLQKKLPRIPGNLL